MRIWAGLILVCVLVGESRAGLTGPETPLDARRRQLLQKLDQAPELGEDPAYPTPNLTLKYDFGEEYYQKKILAIFGLVDMGVAPASRISEANRLLRYEILGKWPASGTSDLLGQYATAWPHFMRDLAMRIWFLYSGWLDSDLKTEYLNRFNWMLAGPQTGSSENIRYDNNNAIFLAHEALGKTSLSTYASTRDWLITNLKSFGKDGAAEWGTEYNTWTLSAILNLAEFAQDAVVRKLATMAVDYWLARQSGFSLGPRFCSGGVRRYGHWIFGHVIPQTHIAKLLFFAGGDPGDAGSGLAEWAVSNFRPLAAVDPMFTNQAPGEARIFENGSWRHQNHRGDAYSIATQQNFETDYYGSGSGTHDEVTCFVQSSGGDDASFVVPYGLPVGAYVKWRCVNDRSFGYKNIGFVHNGGLSVRTWASGTIHNVPSRLFYSSSFTPTIAGPWAFLTDGTTYVAWATAIGDPIVEGDSDTLTNPALGSWLVSNSTPTDDGESSVVEVGDAASFGSFEAFKADIASRNPNPKASGGSVSYKAKDGSTVVFASTGASINGAPVDLSTWPRASMAGLDEMTITAGGANITFDFDNASTAGTLARVAANMHFGSAASNPLAITTPALLPSASQNMAYGPLTLSASGGSGTYVDWVLIAGALPPGIGLSSSGELSGTPSAQGTTSFRIRVFDSAGKVTSRLFSLTVGPPIPLAVTTPGNLPTAQKGVFYSKTLAAQGGSGLYVHWVTIWGVLPPGISVGDSGVLSGTPTTQGTYSFRIRVIDSSGKVASRLFTLTVSP